MFVPQHFGLYFTPDHVAAARKNRELAPYVDAWAMLNERQQQGAEAAQWAGLRYLFAEDMKAGAAGLKGLETCLQTAFEAETTFMQAVEETLVLAHGFEMLRGHPNFELGAQARCLDLIIGRVGYLDTIDYEVSYVESLWQALLHVVTGIVIDREDVFESGVAVFERVIREDVHPQGYIAKAVEAGDGGGLLRQLRAVEALVLTAEAAATAGVDLWSYSFRQVSVMTPASYLLYYYFFPEKWRWDDAVSAEPYQQHNGFFEIAHHRRMAPKDLEPILDELRPIYDAPGGGLTTLSHGVVRRRGRFG